VTKIKKNTGLHVREVLKNNPTLPVDKILGMQEMDNPFLLNRSYEMS
jgi:hypothetical protein